MRFLAAAFATLILVAAPAAAEERITNYSSDVSIQPDSSLEVTETIDVTSEGDLIRHGIYRDFPTLYSTREGGRTRVGFTFEGAERDGHSEPATVEPLSNGVRIKIGDADTLIDPGNHRYVIHYRTTRQVGRFAGYDELYWNVTGNGWIFPIDVAEVTIHLPSPAQFGQRSVYTGPQGSTGQNAEVVNEAPGEITFRTTLPLGAYEGLTVAVAWPKGVVGEPTGNTKLEWWLGDYGPPAVGALGLLGLLAFYFIAWHRVGRDPKAGTVVPIFSPADDLSPAGMRYVVEENVDNRAFAAALVDMGVKGHVKISEEEGGWLSHENRFIERRSSETLLPEEEEAALGRLASVGETIAMKQQNWREFSSAKTALEKSLSSKYEGRLFKRNYGWAATGALMFVAALTLAAFAVDAAMGIASWAWTIFALAVLLGVAAFALLRKEHGTKGSCLSHLVLIIVIASLFPMLPGFFIDAISTGWWFPLALPALALPIVISAFWWISAPTAEGRQVLDRIAGFKQYLSITERDRLDRLTPPDDTPALFEKYLPYAIALGVENHWADRFAPVLAAAAAQGQQGFVWYSGSHSPWSDPGHFVGSVGSSLASSVSSASSAPGSSSGSGGGGSSGGGGGGGGGGW